MVWKKNSDFEAPRVIDGLSRHAVDARRDRSFQDERPYWVFAANAYSVSCHINVRSNIGCLLRPRKRAKKTGCQCSA
jgi:hypothetical protein